MIAIVAACGWHAPAGAADNIPEVATLTELRAAPLLRTGDGTELRLGLSRDGGDDAAGPWRVLYCLVETHGDDSRPATRAATRPDTDVERLGPVRFGLAWRHVRTQLQLSQELKQLYPKGPVLYAGGVRLDRRGVAVLRVFDQQYHPIAQRELTVTEVRPSFWCEFAEEGFHNAGRASEFVVQDEPLPAMPNFGRRGIPLSTTQPLPDLPLPGEMIDAEPADPPLRLSLEEQAFIIRSARKFPDHAPETLLARWWLNGKPVPAVMPRQLRARQGSRKLRQARMVDEARVAFGLPDFLGDLKPDDSIAVQVLYCPGGTELLGAQRMMQVMRLQDADWPWPAPTNRLEFELTPELLAKRNAKPKADD